jgi:hypothetical protein
MRVKAFNVLLIAVILLLLFSIYLFIPFNTTDFTSSSPSNSNFSLNSSLNNSLQFYTNMRFPTTEISYRIENCPLQRENDMQWAFRILGNETILHFYPVSSGEEIIVTCQDKKETEGNLFIAGEGGPTNITIAGEFNVIESGKILLMQDSTCQRPNIAIHELLHVLGFDHSKNPKNIMYEISRCDQTIGDDIINFINTIYSIPDEPDLLFEDASASMHGKYLNINFSIRNDGLKDAPETNVKIMANGKDIDNIDIPTTEIGYGRKVSIENIWIKQLNVQEIQFIINTNYSELNKDNNQVTFEIKK